MDKQVTDAITKAMKEVFDKNQERPHQYVVGYFNKHSEELIGYHYDTFCNNGKEILEGKRYAGENPYPQLEIIFKNLKYTFDGYPHEGMFGEANNKVREGFGKLNLEDIYIDAVYLVEGTPKQDFRYSFLNLNDESKN